MRAVLQRVRWGRVRVANRTIGEIGPGLVILLGVGTGDREAHAQHLAKKVAELRIFADADDKMNRSLLEVGASALVVSQFTLYADVKKGRRPFFGGAAAPERARMLVDEFVRALSALNVPVQTGEFGAMMEVELANDGPVTLVLDTEEWMIDAAAARSQSS
jgi:D-tyrosyl-tRNA(Tyr) deacylase